MKAKTPAGGSFKLELVDDVPRTVTPADATIEVGTLEATQRTIAPDIDPFLAQAQREYDGGKVDEALWARALELANGDKEEAHAPYVRARAAMLKSMHGRKQAAARARASAPAPAPLRAEPAERPRRPAQTRPRPLLLAVLGVAIVGLVTAAWMALSPDDAPAPAPVAAKAVPAAVKSAPVAPAAPVNAGPELAAKVASLKQAGNWHVMVLYANEWTRKEPENAAAWAELSAGYTKLRQIDESFEAAKRAVALDGNNPAYLRRLAEVFVALDRPTEALVQLEKALALDDKHPEALAQSGTLYVAMAKLPEARSAFERALAIDPTNTVASCGALDVARRQGRAKDVEALARALKAAEYECGDAAASKTVAAAAPATPAGASVPVRTVAPAAKR